MQERQIDQNESIVAAHFAHFVFCRFHIFKIHVQHAN